MTEHWHVVTTPLGITRVLADRVYRNRGLGLGPEEQVIPVVVATMSAAEPMVSARLIAAAPELLAALEVAGRWLHSEFCGSMTHRPVCDAAHAAIDKAKGETT